MQNQQQKTIDELWFDSVQTQTVRAVLSDTIVTSSEIFGGEFPLTRGIFSHAIEIKAIGEDAIFFALFFEYVFLVLTSDRFLDFYRKDDNWIWDKKDVSTIEATIMHQEGLLSNATQETLNLFTQLYDREEGLTQLLGESRKKVAKIEHTLRRRGYVRENIKPTTEGKINGNIEEQLVYHEKELNDMNMPQDKKDSEIISTSQKRFREKLFQIELECALRRRPPTQKETEMNTGGIATYPELLDELDAALKAANCLYVTCIYNFLRKRDIFSAYRSSSEDKEQDYKIQTLEKMYEKDVDKKIMTDYYRRYSPVISLKHREKCYILINKQIADWLPFVCGKKRKEIQYDTLQNMFLTQTEEELKEKGIAPVGSDRFSTMEKRTEDVVYHTIHDSINLFKLTFKIKTRIMTMGLAKYHRILKQNEIQFMQGPIDHYSFCVRKAHSTGLNHMAQYYQAAERNKTSMLKLQKIADVQDENVLKKAKDYFYEGIPIEIKAKDLTQKYADIGIVNKKIKVAKLFFYVACDAWKKITKRDLHNSCEEYDESLFASEKKIDLDICAQQYLLDGMIGETLLISWFFTGDTNDETELQKSIKTLRKEIRFTKKMLDKDTRKFFYKHKPDNWREIETYGENALLNTLQSGFWEKEVREDTKRILQRQTLQLQSIRVLIRKAMEHMVKFHMKSHFFDLCSRIVLYSDSVEQYHQEQKRLLEEKQRRMTSSIFDKLWIFTVDNVINIMFVCVFFILFAAAFVFLSY